MEQALMTLSQYHGAPAVTILLSTHRTHPDNKQDPINLKKLVAEAETRLYDTSTKGKYGPYWIKSRPLNWTSITTITWIASPFLRTTTAYR